MEMKNSELNGIILVVGTIVLATGVWIEYTFGMSLITLGATWIATGLLAKGDEE